MNFDIFMSWVDTCVQSHVPLYKSFLWNWVAETNYERQFKFFKMWLWIS